MKESLKTKSKKIGLLAGSTGAAALTLIGTIHNEKNIPNYNEALAAQGLTQDQFSNMRDAVKPLEAARENLVYLPPDCYTALGIIRVCKDEVFPSVPEAIEELDNSIKHLQETNEAESLQAVTDVRASIDRIINLDKPVTVETHSAQRMALNQTANDLEIRVSTVASETKDATNGSFSYRTKRGSLLTAFGVSSLVAAGTLLSFNKRVREKLG